MSVSELRERDGDGYCFVCCMRNEVREMMIQRESPLCVGCAVLCWVLGVGLGVNEEMMRKETYGLLYCVLYGVVAVLCWDK